MLRTLDVSLPNLEGGHGPRPDAYHGAESRAQVHERACHRHAADGKVAYALSVFNYKRRMFEANDIVTALEREHRNISRSVFFENY